MIPDRYNINNIRRALTNPKLLQNEIKRIMSHPVYLTNDLLFELRYDNGVNVVEKDWDILIILDACRYDYFKEINNIPGTLNSVVSKGSNSKEFIKKNFSGEKLHDTVYITANPHGVRLLDNEFYTIESLISEWDPEIETVLPEDVERAAMNADHEYQNKRLIIHFMQPHSPHIGGKAEELRKQVDMAGWSGGFDSLNSKKTGQAIWDYVESGEISHEDLQEAYKESLEIVLDHAERLADNINGKTVITADHGEMLGERIFPISSRIYEHPSINSPELRIIPWHTIQSDSRRIVKEEPPIEYDQENEEVIDDRLSALGYKVD